MKWQLLTNGFCSILRDSFRGIVIILCRGFRGSERRKMTYVLQEFSLVWWFILLHPNTPYSGLILFFKLVTATLTRCKLEVDLLLSVGWRWCVSQATGNRYPRWREAVPFNRRPFYRVYRRRLANYIFCNTPLILALICPLFVIRYSLKIKELSVTSQLRNYL